MKKALNILKFGFLKKNNLYTFMQNLKNITSSILKFLLKSSIQILLIWKNK